MGARTAPYSREGDELLTLRKKLAQAQEELQRWSAKAEQAPGQDEEDQMMPNYRERQAYWHERVKDFETKVEGEHEK